jgi:DNA-binding MarR family transcriptional regulator
MTLPAPRMPAKQIPAAGEARRGVDGHIAYLLRQANATVRQRLEHDLAGLGVTQPQFAVLTMLGAYGALSGAEIARLTFLTPQTVNVITANLLRDGAVTRQADPANARILRHSLTPAGVRLLKDCRVHAERLEAWMLAGLDAPTEAAIRAWLIALATG